MTQKRRNKDLVEELGPEPAQPTLALSGQHPLGLGFVFYSVFLGKQVALEQ